MSKVQVTIAMSVLNALSPQPRMLNTKKEEIENQVFTLHSVFASRDTTNNKERVADLGKVNDDLNFVKAKYMSEKGKAYVIPIRALLGLDIAVVTSENDTITDETPRIKVYERLTELGSATDKVALPETFTVLSVVPATQRGTDNVMYPQYMYKRFNERVKELQENDANADLAPIYSDFSFISSLYADGVAGLEDMYKSAEPNKSITIKM